MQRPALALIGAAPQAVGRGGENLRPAPEPHRQAVNVLVERLVAQRRAMAPGVATVAAAVHAVDLDAHPNRARVARIEYDVGDLGRSGEALLGDRDRKPLPSLAAIERAEHRRRLGAGIDDRGVLRMNRDRPNLHPVHRRRHQFKARAVVHASIQAGFGARVHLMRIVRRKRQRANLDFAGLGVKRQRHLAAPPMVAAVGAEPHAGADRSHTDRELLSHRSHPASLSRISTDVRRCRAPLAEVSRYSLGGFFSSNLRLKEAIPAATLRPF